jgi:glutathione S-transferase
MRCRL